MSTDASVAQRHGLPDRVYVQETADKTGWLHTSKLDVVQKNVTDKSACGDVVGVYELVRVVRLVRIEETRLVPIVETDGPKESGGGA